MVVINEEAMGAFLGGFEYVRLYQGAMITTNHGTSS
jgi:hypothetical protein